MKTSEGNPLDWLRAGCSRLASVDRLHASEGASEAVVELLQESAERLLKAYLISHGWKLVKTHDLNRLVAEACDYDTRFRDFARMAEELTQQFWEQHYPGGDLTDIGEHYKTLRSQVEAMRSLVEETVRVSPKSPIPEG